MLRTTAKMAIHCKWLDLMVAKHLFRVWPKKETQWMTQREEDYSCNNNFQSLLKNLTLILRMTSDLLEVPTHHLLLITLWLTHSASIHLDRVSHKRDFQRHKVCHTVQRQEVVLLEGVNHSLLVQVTLQRILRIISKISIHNNARKHQPKSRTALITNQHLRQPPL
jgi:hypothetical protein